jgi:steroid 5-alpha reductase family enzyme
VTFLIALLLTNAAVSAAAFVVLWLISLKLKDVSFIDGWWGLGMALIAWTAWLQAGPTPHGTLLAGLCTVWGLRLGAYLLWRWRRHGPDKRYVDMLNHAREFRGWSFGVAALLLVFSLQWILQLIVALPVQLGQGAGGPLAPLALAGAGLAGIGILFETIGDAQLVAFKAKPENAGKVMDRGLWRYTRHPNYFGDACVWWGLYLIAAETGLGAWALPGPVLITFLLTKGSGVPTVEGSMRKKRPDYEAYVARTSGFLPWFPKATGKHST